MLQHVHATYYLSLAEAAAAQWDTPTVDSAIELLNREHDNIRAALQWACEGGDLTIGLQLAGALWRFWRGSGAINEGRAWLADLLALDAVIPWSPDGAHLADGGDNGSVYLWDADGELLQRLEGHHSPVTCVDWSPSGVRLASGGSGKDGGELFIWDSQSGECVCVGSIAEHSGMVSALAWSSSDDLLVTGGGDGVLRWWNAQSGECLFVREAHLGTIQSLRRSPDGHKLASCGDDGSIKLWNLHNGEYLDTLRRDRPYERLNITGVRGLTEAQKATLRALGAI